MNDFYTEQLVKRKTTGKVMLAKAGLIILTLVSLILLLKTPFALILTMVLIVLDIFPKNELEKLPGIQLFRLTNRIRTNVELSSFIQNLMHLPDRKTTRHFPNVTVLYANDEREAENLMLDAGEHGFQILSRQEDNGKTMDRLAVLLDEKYYYDENRYLRSQDHTVRTLFYRLNGAKEKLMIVVKENAPVYERVLELL